MSGSDRNHPCKCGSGKKYKRCCLVTEEAASSSAAERAEAERKAASIPRLGLHNSPLISAMGLIGVALGGRRSV